MKQIIFVMTSIIIATSANAELPVTDPAIACGFLRDAGITTRKWFSDNGNDYWCASDYKSIGNAFPLPNNLAYYVEGSESSVKLIKIVININNPLSPKTAHAALLAAAQELQLKLFDSELPGSYADAITRGNQISGKIDGTDIEVQRSNWPSGNGYDIKIIYR